MGCECYAPYLKERTKFVNKLNILYIYTVYLQAQGGTNNESFSRDPTTRDKTARL